MFKVIQEFPGKSAHKYTITINDKPASFKDILKLWQDDMSFREFFITLLNSSPFSAYRWETPPVNQDTVTRDFEFVLLDSAGLSRPVDTVTFREYFTRGQDDDGIVIFDNLGKDATLIAPTPGDPVSAYGHLAAFNRNAPVRQIHALWRCVGETVEQHLTEHPLWLSTAGGGVAWLHIRLDSLPKYYGCTEYINFESFSSGRDGNI